MGMSPVWRPRRQVGARQRRQTRAGDSRGPERSTDRTRVAALLVIVAVLTAGCGASTAASSPATPPPSPGAVPSQPIGSPEAVAVRWEPAGTSAFQLNDYFHAVALVDGRVLVVGSTQSGPLTELWDPASGAWREVTPLNKPRYAFAAVALADGRALVVGGLNEGDGLGQGGHQSFSSAYVFDPAPGREAWEKVGLMDVARTAPAAARLLDGRVLVAGGYYYAPAAPGEPWFGRALATAELFDPATGLFSRVGSMGQARAGAAAVTLTDGRILVVGSGAFSVDRLTDAAFSSAEIFDPRTGRFSPVGGLPAVDHEAIAAMGVQLPESDGEPWTLGTLVALPDGGAVLVGRTRRWSDGTGQPVAEVTRMLRFDVWTGSWSEVGTPWVSAIDPASERLVATPGTQHQAAFVARLGDGTVLIAGGTTGGSVTAAAELFEPATGRLIPVTDMPEGRADGDAVLLPDGSVLLVGGYVGDGTFAGTALRMLP